MPFAVVTRGIVNYSQVVIILSHGDRPVVYSKSLMYPDIEFHEDIVAQDVTAQPFVADQTRAIELMSLTYLLTCS